MPARLTLIRHVTSSFGMRHKLALLALAGVAAASMAYDANRAFTQAVDRQIDQEESAFCLKLGIAAGARDDACLQDVARLVRKENEIRAVEF